MRKYMRHLSDVPIMYDLVDVVDDQKDYLKNISMGGLCFRSKKYIEEGTTVLIQLPLINPIFESMGVVVWCKRSAASYEVGVQFIDEETEFRTQLVDHVCYIEQYKRNVFEKEGRTLSGEEAALEWFRKYMQEISGGAITLTDQTP